MSDTQDLAAQLATVVAVLEDVRDDVRETKEQVKLTNGRVTELEKWRARFEGALAVIGWAPATGIALIGAIAGAVATAIIGG